ncbi:MAG TPA: hypothetical protein VGM18_12285 [Candidatus Sulfotelmatobacter sp.]|jgi:hypothetical protein
MEGLTRLVTESLARHGFDRPLDYRRLQWSRWFRCESPHSLLFVPSKPGVFALAEEVMDLGNAHVGTNASTHVGTDAFVRPASEASSTVPRAATGEPEARPRRMLAVTQFFEDDDMAFVLDRMLSIHNPMAARLTSGRYFARFVVIADPTQRRSICNALNQWIVSSAEKVTGIGSHFASSLELTDATEHIAQPDAAQRTLFGVNNNLESADPNVARALLPATPDTIGTDAASTIQSPIATNTTYAKHPTHAAAPHLDSGAASNIHCPTPFPSGF